MTKTLKSGRSRKWKTAYNKEEFPKGYEKPRGESLTIPDQSMSLKTLLERFTRGLPLPSASGYGPEQYYGDDPDYMINPAVLDISEKHELIDQQKIKVNEIAKAITEQQQQEVEKIRIAKEEAIKNNQPKVESAQPTVK